MDDKEVVDVCRHYWNDGSGVASSALLIFSILDYSNQDSTAPSFLLHTSVGAEDNKCLLAAGSWPAGAVSATQDDDDPSRLPESDAKFRINGPFITCFSFQYGENYCWSHS